MKPNSVNSPLFFIIGRPRSGTTLLSVLFDAHPNVIIPGECNFMLALSLKYQHIKTIDAKIIRQFIMDLKSTKFFKNIAIDLNILEQNLMTLAPQTNFHEIIGMVHLSFTSVYPKGEILLRGDKNPSYSSELFHKIIHTYTDAKYIHMIRDVHDHIGSVLSSRFLLPSATYMAIAWKKSIERLAKYKKKKPEQFYTLRYEDFVENPEKHTQDLCSFLNLPYHPEILKFYLKKDEYQSHQPYKNFENHHKALFNPINKSRIGNWHALLKGNDLAAVELIAGKTAAQFGYEYKQHKLNAGIIYLLIKWYLYYFLVIILRAFVFSLPLRKRYKIIGKLKENRIIIKLFRKISRRNALKK